MGTMGMMGLAIAMAVATESKEAVDLVAAAH